MSRYRKVDVRVWSDGKFRGLSKPPPNAQTLWFFLLTGPQTSNIPGLFSMGEAAMAEALGWSVKDLRRCFAEVSQTAMAKAAWEDRLVWVPNAIKYNRPESPNVVKGWRVTWDELPESPLKAEAYASLKAFVEGLGEGFAKAFQEALGEGLPEGFGEPFAQPLANQEQEQEPEQEQEQERLPPADPEPLRELWNAKAHPSLPRCRELTKKRLPKAIERVRERSLAEWEAIILRISASAFCRGERGDRGWTANFDWLIQPDTATKVLEGKYDDPRGKSDLARDLSPARVEESGQCDGCGAAGTYVGATWGARLCGGCAEAWERWDPRVDRSRQPGWLAAFQREALQAGAGAAR